MSGKENMLLQSLDDVLQRAEESLGITPSPAKLHTDPKTYFGRKLRESAQQGMQPYATAPPANFRRSFAASPTSSSDSEAESEARSQDARVNWEAALASKDKALAQLEEALAAERKAAEQTRITAAAALSQADAKRSSASATDAALAEARREADQLRRQACISHLAWRNARIAEARQAAAAAASGSADQAARTEHHMAMMQAQVRDLQASLAQQTASAQQHLGRAEAAQAANSALQNEIMLLQARLSEQNEALQRTRHQENMSAPGPADWTQRRDTPAENHVTGVMPSAKTLAAVEGDKGLERQFTRLQERLVSRDASARKYKEAVKVLKSRVLEAIKVAKINQEDCERLRGQLAESEQAQQAIQESLGSTRSQLATAQRQAADAEQSRAIGLQERDEAQRRAQALQLRAEKAEKYALKVHRLLEALRSHMEAAQKQEAAAQQQASPHEQSITSLKAQLSEAAQAAAAASTHAHSIQERLAIKEGQCEQLQAALSEERRQCSQARQQASELEANLKGLWEEAGTLKSKLAEAVAVQGRAREEAGKELAAAKIAWELRRRDELQDLQVQVDRTLRAQEAAEARLAELEKCEASRTSQSAAGSEAHSAPAAACRMQKLKEVLDMRERCIAHLQDKLRHQQAHHAQIETGLRAQLEKRVKALEDADKRFGELESLMRRLSARSGIL
ncbi:hypothetical protein COCSUDRAFT_58961 [Coccomyxa subellipsoidea C-169]|uniref:Uncharacterized protein n=1 Tax=Coccomyxa subellipsoidea (strain C-169) TaxID=574566 RepID=I0Z704_COCSC|nr:hypothetical protein COCSUDRAFT_58961 [Coccomyxa subellipsoidea C-169]EIE26423.1 hypothetical protein COCSUDRAFT_58961 [Coccomyxa subellipsoidea C-169]|eukprot:XP_005650967.1 hypothetical protein COCSUDRAFT_58961 [Coccomyxa subellipsoidea C-169]